MYNIEIQTQQNYKNDQYKIIFANIYESINKNGCENNQTKIKKIWAPINKIKKIKKISSSSSKAKKVNTLNRRKIKQETARKIRKKMKK